MLIRFFRNCSGNFGLFTGLLMVPLTVAAGLSLDVTNALGVKTHLQSVADAAALSVVASNSASYRQAMAMPANGRVSIGERDAVRYFRSALSDVTSFAVEDVSAKVTRQGNQLTAALTYTAKVPTSLLGVIGKPVINVKGTAIANFQTAMFRDFYLVLDNSPSMGLGATTTDIARMEASFGCAFACHDLSQAENNYTKAKALGVMTRINYVTRATDRLLETAKTDRWAPNQYRAAIYSFGASATAHQLTEVMPLTSNLDAARAAVAAIDLMTTPYETYGKRQLSDLSRILNSLAGKIGPNGTGITAASPQKVIFLVSDGLNESRNPSGCTKPVADNTRCQEPIRPSVCQTLKGQGYTLAVLYTTYLPMPENEWYQNWISPFQPELRTRMEQCATPGLFFEVGPRGGITEAMLALFQKVIAMPRITS